MGIVVHKYGGSSVADANKISNVARRIVESYKQGFQVVAVVSAMGKTTDDLINLANSLNTDPSPREMDLLMSTGEIVSCSLVSMAVSSLGFKSIALTGEQAGVRTDQLHTKARINKMVPARINKELDEGKIVVVAGFQGVNEDNEVTTLGRGASDLSAVALAIGLNADRCEIYTDVEGIFDADPNIVKNAQLLPYISFEEMLEMANYGAKMQPRSIELAAAFNMPIFVKSSFKDSQGTIIGGENTMENDNRVNAVTVDKNVAKITILSVPDKPGVAVSIFKPLSEKGISVDTIVQNAGSNNITDLTFTVARSDLNSTIEIIKDLIESIGAKGFETNSNLVKISVIGTGMQNNPGYATSMFGALADNGVNIELITTSEIRITCIIDENQIEIAANALHSVFGLSK